MRKYLLGLSWLSLTTAGVAGPVAFDLDPVHTQIVFSVEHAGFSMSTGKLLRPTGMVLFDEKNWAASSVQVEMQAANVEFDDADWNKAVRGKSYFNAEEFPTLRFVSTACVKTSADAGFLTGELTLLGVSKTVQLNVTFNKRARHPYTLKDTLGFSATGSLKRSDFGMLATAKTVGDLVSLRISLEAIRRTVLKPAGKR
jgi:polyisoprenoid-binding protein YceI